MPERIVFKSFVDSRGLLLACETLPFVPKRFFIIRDLLIDAVRGGHAHKVTHQFFICLRGEVSVYTDDGRTSVRGCTLSNPSFGLHVLPLTWVDLRMKQGAELLVFASELYDPAEYVNERSLL